MFREGSAQQLVLTPSDIFLLLGVVRAHFPHLRIFCVFIDVWFPPGIGASGVLVGAAGIPGVLLGTNKCYARGMQLQGTGRYVNVNKGRNGNMIY